MATPAERHRVEGNGHWVRPAGEPLGAVVRDVFDNTREILRDTVAIGALEVRRATLDVKHTAADLGPRVAWATLAFVTGTVAVIIGLIALFIAAGVFIPSIAARLGILAGMLLLVAAFGAWRAGRKPPPPARRSNPALVDHGVVPLHPLDGVGE